MFLCFSSLTWSQSHPRPTEVWNEFRQWVDHNYIFFETKSVNWDSVCRAYTPVIHDTMSDEHLFDIMESALLQLKDAHSLLYRPGKVSRYYNYLEGQQAHYDWSVIRNHYIRDSLRHENDVFWGMLDHNAGYIRMDVFDISSAFIKAIRSLRSRDVSSLVIDVRHNRGGDSNLVPRLLGQMVHKKTALGAYIEKTGPRYEDVTPPVWIYAEPADSVTWDLPVVVLIDKVSYSATSYFAAMVKGLPGMTLVGQTTGGGAGGHLGYQLSNGWLLRVSVSDFIGKDRRSIELGVEPDIPVANTYEDLLMGRDIMLETAMKVSF